MKKILWLIMFEVISVIIWNISLLRIDKETEYFVNILIMFIALPAIFLISIMLIDNKFHFFKHIIGYPVLLYAYSIYITIYVMVVSYYIELEGIALQVYKLRNSPIFDYGYYALFPFITTLCSLLLAWFEKKRLSNRNKWILFFTSFVIPVIGFIISFLIYLIYKLLSPELTPSIQSIYNPGYWFTVGGLQFAIILYFGIYYLGLKEKMIVFGKKETVISSIVLHI